MMRSTSSPDLTPSKQAHSSASCVKDRIKRIGMRLLAILFWMVVWHTGSITIGQDILLVSPLVAIKTLFELMGTAEFYQAIGSSLSRILLGFALGVMLGTLLAMLSYFVPLVGELFAPLMHTIKATPVASFVILALIFIRTQYLSVLMAFLMVLPILYTNVLTGLRGTDPKLLEMARIFRMRPTARLWGIYLPAAYPNFLSSCALALGMSWKAGIAAEVIALPDRSIGEALYQAKIFFSTPEMFAWTLAIILLSFLLEQGIVWLVRLLSKRLEGGAK